MELTTLKTSSSSNLWPFKVLSWNKNGNYEILLRILEDFLNSLINPVSISWNQLKKITRPPTKPDVKETILREEFFSSADVNMLMDKLGIQHWENDGDAANVVEVSSVFDQEEPSLEEAKVAFDVFDENRDGFIDEIELQKLLCKLGQPGQTDLVDCRNMIKSYDVNGDGVIDFDEFVKLIEKCSF